MRRTYQLNVRVAIFLVLVLLCSAFLVPSSATAKSSTTIQLWIGNASMSINGVQKPIDSQGTKPVVSSGRTLLPIRSVIEAFGGSVDWESSTSKITVKLGKNSLELWIGKPQASLNGTTKAIDAANPAVVPVIMNGRTMLPIRFVAESLGINVQYDDVTSMITLQESQPSQLTVYCNLLLGDIYVDGERTASVQGSFGRTIKGLLPGTHTVKITESGYADWSKQVSIEAGKTTTLYAYLALGADNGAPSRNEVITPDSAASYGSLTVYSNMLNSNIYVGGEPGGTTQGSRGRTIKGLLPGTYTVKITESGYKDWTGQVTISAGQTATIDAKLVQK